MSDGLNRVLLLGNLGADPEFKMLPNGGPMLKLRIATTESYLDKSKTRQEKTEWHSVTLWGNRAEGLSKILTKGSRVFIEGSLKTRSYDKDGEKRYSTEVNATNVILAGDAKGASHSDDSPKDTRSQLGLVRTPASFDESNEIPF